MRAPLRLVVSLLSLVALPLLGGCSEHYIPNTDVEDTDDNREVVGFCETYRRAVERKDATALLQMVSPDYYEDGGNADASDDMDYVQFKKYLLGEVEDPDAEVSFLEAMAIRHEIRYRRITRENGRVLVDYTYSASFRIPTEKGEDWKRKVDDNRLELVQAEDGKFHIVAGM